MQLLEFTPLEIVTLPLESDEGMGAGPLNKKQRLDNYEGRLKKVEEGLGLRPAEPQKNFWDRKQEWVKNNSWISLLLSVILTGTTIFGGYWLNHRTEWWNHDVDARVEYVLNKKGGVIEKLSTIQDTVTRTEATLSTLTPYIHDTVNHSFESASKLPPTALQERLPAMKHLFDVAQDQRFKIQPTIIASLSEHFLQIPKRESVYWQAAGSLISYRSFNSSSWALPSHLSDCMDSRPQRSATRTISSSLGNMQLNLGAYENCRLTLDSVKDGQRLEELLREFATLWFSKCEILYHGGPLISVLALNGHMRTVASLPGKGGGTFDLGTDAALKFQDCQFEFSIPQLPPPPGQQLTEFMLAQNKPTVELPISRQEAK